MASHSSESVEPSESSIMSRKMHQEMEQAEAKEPSDALVPSSFLLLLVRHLLLVAMHLFLEQNALDL